MVPKGQQIVEEVRGFWQIPQQGGWKGVRSVSPLIWGFPLAPHKVDGAIASCSEMHDMKEAIYEYKKKLEGIGEDYQIQVRSSEGLLASLPPVQGDLSSWFCTGMRRM